MIHKIQNFLTNVFTLTSNGWSLSVQLGHKDIMLFQYAKLSCCTLHYKQHKAQLFYQEILIPSSFKLNEYHQCTKSVMYSLPSGCYLRTLYTSQMENLFWEGIWMLSLYTRHMLSHVGASLSYIQHNKQLYNSIVHVTGVHKVQLGIC